MWLLSCFPWVSCAFCCRTCTEVDFFPTDDPRECARRYWPQPHSGGCERCSLPVPNQLRAPVQLRTREYDRRVRVTSQPPPPARETEGRTTHNLARGNRPPPLEGTTDGQSPFVSCKAISCCFDHHY